jgi:hypothetical protein
MLEVLREAEKQLSTLLHCPEGWNSLYIDYEKPLVERAWRDFGEYRLYLHHIHPCEEGDALWHPHPWPSAIKIVSGSYWMNVGNESLGSGYAPVAARLFLPEGSVYEMTDINGWHSVQPVEDVYSIMVTGKKWGRSEIRADRPLRPLTAEEKAHLLQEFRRAYPR